MREATTPATGAEELEAQGRRLINAEWIKPGKGQTDMAQDAAEALVAAGWRPPPTREDVHWAAVAEVLRDTAPVDDVGLRHLADAFRDLRCARTNSNRTNWHCLNLAAYIGERFGPVLRRLLDAEVEAARLARKLAAPPASVEGEAGDQAEGLPTVLDPAAVAEGGEGR